MVYSEFGDCDYFTLIREREYCYKFTGVYHNLNTYHTYLLQFDDFACYLAKFVEQNEFGFR